MINAKELRDKTYNKFLNDLRDIKGSPLDYVFIAIEEKALEGEMKKGFSLEQLIKKFDGQINLAKFVAYLKYLGYTVDYSWKDSRYEDGDNTITIGW